MSLPSVKWWDPPQNPKEAVWRLVAITASNYAIYRLGRRWFR